MVVETENDLGNSSTDNGPGNSIKTAAENSNEEQEPEVATPRQLGGRNSVIAMPRREFQRVVMLMVGEVNLCAPKPQTPQSNADVVDTCQEPITEGDRPSHLQCNRRPPRWLGDFVSHDEQEQSITNALSNQTTVKNYRRVASIRHRK